MSRTKNWFQDVLAPVICHLDQLGATFRIQIDFPVKPIRIDRFERKMGLAFPAELRQFYGRISNGITFVWGLSDAEYHGYIEIPTIDALLRARKFWVEVVRTDREPEFENGSDSKCAAAAWARMEDWIPLLDESDGNYVCIDAKTGEIVWHNHEWESGIGHNGNIIDRDLLTWMTNWADRCFVNPAGLWKEVTSAEGRTADWQSSVFCNRFRLPARLER